MKFDIDCARDILLTVEACKLNDVMYIKDLKNELFQYDPDEISYMCLKLYEADFINATCKKSASVINIVRINDITYEGHQFLANIRERLYVGKGETHRFICWHFINSHCSENCY